MQTAFAARVRRVVSFLRLRGLPKDLRRDIQRFYESEWASTGGNTFSEVLFIVTLQGQYTWALMCQNCFFVRQRRYRDDSPIASLSPDACSHGLARPRL